jgi:hypothetical protein
MSRLPQRLVASLFIAAVSTAMAAEPPPASKHTDLALGKKVTGSPICKPGEEAEKAVNGKLASKTQDKFCTKQVPSWLRIDLGKVSQVSGFTIKHAGAGDEPADMNTRAFAVRVSTDGNDWKQVVEVSDNTASITEHRIAPMPVRYVELDVTKPTQTDDPATRIYEVEVW